MRRCLQNSTSPPTTGLEHMMYGSTTIFELLIIKHVNTFMSPVLLMNKKLKLSSYQRRITNFDCDRHGSYGPVCGTT